MTSGYRCFQGQWKQLQMNPENKVKKKLGVQVGRTTGTCTYSPVNIWSEAWLLELERGGNNQQSARTRQEKQRHSKQDSSLQLITQ